MNANKKIYIFLFFTILVYLGMVLITVPIVHQYSKGMFILDLKLFGYTLEYAKSLLETLGVDGRNAYLYKQLPLDFLYPGLFMITFSLIIKKLYSYFVSNKRIVGILSIFPILGGGFDYLENIGEVVILYNYSKYLDNIIPIINIFSISKTLFSTIAIVLVISGLLLLGYRKYVVGKIFMGR